MSGGVVIRVEDSVAWEWIEPAGPDAATADRLFASYDSGSYADFDEVIGTLASSLTNPFEFEADAERWIRAGSDAARRSLVAAAVALELAVAQRPKAGLDATSIGRELTTLHLNFVLAEVGCAFLRDHPPVVAERSWHEAFVALARTYDREDHVTTPPRVRNPDADKALAKKDDLQRKEAQRVMQRVRKLALRSSRSSRIEMSRVKAEHDGHLSTRFRDDPLVAFLNASVREKALAVAGVAERLLPGRHSTVWLDATEVEQLAKGGPLLVRTVQSNHRMDRPSAETLFRILPELRNLYDPADHVFRTNYWRSQPSGVAVSLALWDIVDGFRAGGTGEAFTAEASLRLGRTYARLAQPDLALPALLVADSRATSSYERYLSRLFAGAVFEHAGRRTDAIAAFRGALQAVPRAQSASLALAPLLLERDERDEAAAILDAAMRLPLADDPLHYYYQGDPDAAPRALAQLRRETRR